MDVAAAPKLKPDDLGTTAAPDAVIEVNDLSLCFDTADGEVLALSNVNLRIARGDFVSFIGPSGCGKTTLLRAVADLETPSSGSIRVNGMSPQRSARQSRLWLRVPGPGALSLAQCGAEYRIAARNHGLQQGRA